MLHIILLILKIIGFLILGILALILLLTVIFLLAPFVYKLDFSVDNSLESMKGRIRFHWLMHLISGEVSYEGGSLEWKIRAAWKKFGTDETDTVTAEPQESPAEITDRMTAKRSAEKTEEEIRSENTDSRSERPRRSGDVSPERSTRSEEDRSGHRTGSKKTSGLYERILKIPEKIKYTFRKICDKIRSLKKKKDRIEAFLKNETHQNAFSRLIKEIKRLFHFLRPSDASVDLVFGFTDPAHTGYTLAAISMISPMIGEFTQLKPDFEHKVLKGEAYIKGKIRVLYAVIFAWNMLFDRNVRTTYRHIRKFRL